MDFRLNPDQEALREGLRSFCEGRVPVEQLAELEKTDAFDRDLWRELAEMGVFGLRIPESEGGVGLGTADAVLVFSELGRRVVPGPIVWTHLAAGLVQGADAGETVVGGLDLVSAPDGPHLVEHFAHSDALLLLRADGVFRVSPNELEAEPIEMPLDPLTPLHHVAVLPEGDRVGDAELARRMRRDGAALAAGFFLGISEATTELAVDYAKKREQFDRPIGSFQAIKHILADMFVRQEVARAAAYAGGATIDQPEAGDVERAVSAAKIIAGDSAMKNSKACIQVHGGMGYTWEVPAHYYLKRTFVLESQFGSVDEHSSRVAAHVAEGV